MAESDKPSLYAQDSTVAASVGVHFHRSYEDGFDLVHELQSTGS